MKKILAIALAAVLMLSVMAVSAFAADTTVMLEVGPNIDNLTDSERVDIAKSGTYTIKVESEAPIDGVATSTFMSIKIAKGNVSQNTALPNGTTITLKSVKLGDTEVAVKADQATYTVKDGTLDFMLKFMDWGFSANVFEGELPNGFTTVEVTIEVVNPESGAEAAPEAPAENDTPAAPAENDAPAAPETNEAPAPATNNAPAAPATGLALAVVPAVVALAAVAVSKKH